MKTKNFSNIKVEPDDVEVRFKLGDKLGSITPFKYEYPPFFSFEYSIFDKNALYSFDTSEISKEEYKIFMSVIKEISITKMCDITSNEKLLKYNFKINNDVNNELKLILKYVSKKSIKLSENFPPVGHFHLFAKPARTNEKCSVVHFFIGPKAIIYILCYDKYHTIHKICNDKLTR